MDPVFVSVSVESRPARAQITVIVLLLARLVHWQPALAGLGATTVLVPLTAAITRKAAAVRKRLVERTDARVKLCTETVTGPSLELPGFVAAEARPREAAYAEFDIPFVRHAAQWYERLQ